MASHGVHALRCVVGKLVMSQTGQCQMTSKGSVHCAHGRKAECRMVERCTLCGAAQLYLRIVCVHRRDSETSFLDVTKVVVVILFAECLMHEAVDALRIVQRYRLVAHAIQPSRLVLAVPLRHDARVLVYSESRLVDDKPAIAQEDGTHALVC